MSRDTVESLVTLTGVDMYSLILLSLSSLTASLHTKE